MSLLRKLPRYVAKAGVAVVGTSCCYNVYNPLNVIWDLDETLVSSEEKPVFNPKPGKEYVVRKVADAVEHVDDDGLHFITTARPYAITVLRLLRLLPGCEQFVSTSASLGYMNNVLELLDPAGRTFQIATAGQCSSGKNVFDTLPPGRDLGLRRTVLVDNRASCHTPQPKNGMVVADFVHPQYNLVLLENAPAEKEVGRYLAAVSASNHLETAVFKGAQGSFVELAIFENSTDSEVALARRGSARLSTLASDAAASGAKVLVVYDPKRETSCFPIRCDKDVAIPVLSVGSSACRAMKVHMDVKIAIHKAQDRELLKTLAKLLLCWFVPDVRWVLSGDASASSI